MSEREMWLTVGPAADRLAIHPDTLARAAKRGEITYMETPGGVRKFHVSDLDDFKRHSRFGRRRNQIPEDLVAPDPEPPLSIKVMETKQEPARDWLLNPFQPS